MTGSAFAARALITGADIQDGSITRADLSGRTIKSLKGKHGPTGPAGRDGFAGPQGPQGSTGPEGPRGADGPAGPRGDRGETGDTGRIGPLGPKGDQGDTGNTGDTGPQGLPGQSIASNVYTGTTPIDLGTPLALNSTGPTDPTDGVDLTSGVGDIFLGAGQYLVHVGINVTDASASDPGAEYGVSRLFLDTTPLDGAASDPTGGGADASTDTLLVTGDVPDDGNPAQASGTYLINVGDDGNGGETLSLHGAVRTAEPDGASATAHVTVTHIG